MPDFKALREARGMTQSHLAEAAGLSVKTVVRLEKGEQVSAETMMAVRSVLDMGVPSNEASIPSVQVSPVQIQESTTTGMGTRRGIWIASIWKKWFPPLMSVAKVSAIFLFSVSAGAIMMFSGGLFFGLPQWAHLSPVNRLPIVEAIGMGSESLFLGHGRGLLVRADILTRLGPVPAMPTTDINWRGRAVSQPLPWPDAITINLSDSERERVRTTAWNKIGNYSDSERLIAPTGSGLSLGEEREAVADRMRLWSGHARYDIGMSVMPDPNPGMTITFSPINERSCRLLLVSSQNLASGRMFVQVLPSRRGEMATSMRQSPPDLPMHHPKDAVSLCQNDLVSMRFLIFSRQQESAP